MKITDVQNDDAKRCAQILKLISIGRWDLSGGDADEFVKVKAWLQSLAQAMSADLTKTKPQESSTTAGMRVKSMGALPASAPKPMTKLSKGAKSGKPKGKK